MLKQVLELISKGKSSISEIAKEMQVENSSVISAISELKRLGYLETNAACSMDKPACSSCPFAKKAASMGTVFSLTKKGKEYLKKD